MKSLEVERSLVVSIQLNKQDMDELYHLGKHIGMEGGIIYGDVFIQAVKILLEGITISEKAKVIKSDDKRKANIKEEASPISHKKRHRLKHPERDRARTRVTTAISLGKMRPAKETICVDCGKQAHSYHHHNGYDEKHALDVITLCLKCHRTMDKIKTNDKQ